MRHETDMFGPRNPFHGYDKPAELNEFLVQHNGRRCLVFLDEFEKTTTEVRQALFIPFDNGKHYISTGDAGFVPTLSLYLTLAIRRRIPGPRQTGQQRRLLQESHMDLGHKRV